MKTTFNKLICGLAASAALFAVTWNANAESFDFSFTVTDGNFVDSGYGTLQASPDAAGGPGAYLATSGKLTLNVIEILAGPPTAQYLPNILGTYDLLSATPPAASDGVFYGDNLIYPNDKAGNGISTGVYNPSYLTQWGGLNFGANPGTEFHLSAIDQGAGKYTFLASYGPGYGYFYNPAPGTTTFELHAVPEPSTFFLLGLGAIALAIRTIRRRRLPSVA